MCKSAIDRLRVERLAVPTAAEPASRVIMLGTLRFAPSLHETLVARDAATVFGRTGVLTADANRMPRIAVVVLGDGFDRYGVVPTVAEVVLVHERVPHLRRDSEEPRRGLILGPGNFHVWIRVLDIADAEHVQVHVLPTHLGLDDMMQRTQVGLAYDEYSAPYLRLNVLE